MSRIFRVLNCPDPNPEYHDVRVKVKDGVLRQLLLKNAGWLPGETISKATYLLQSNAFPGRLPGDTHYEDHVYAAPWPLTIARRTNAAFFHPCVFHYFQSLIKELL